ncbi:MAG: hypothetical protein K9L85_03200 [Candidatus Peribacteraceae bacterium]|nr:hypothetical protein [Candidatus Peribacteraceae bacterium]
MSARKDFYSVARDEAAERLGVSTRTLDRYIKSGKLRVKLSPSRQVLIHSQDLSKLNTKRKPFKKARTRKEQTAEPSAEPIEVATDNAEEKVFRELYEEANRELKTKQEKLEAASFRVGQLEAQLKSSVPLLEYKEKEQTLLGENSKLKEKLVATILKSWIFLAVAGLATAVAAALALLNYL